MVFQKICFVGADVYPVLKPGFGRAYVGGESVQISLISKAFLELGYEVSLIDRDYGQDPIENLYGIKVIKTFDRKKGVPIVRFFHPRLSSIIRALENADADVYYQSCADMMTGVVAWFCKRRRRKFIFRTAHDYDCIPEKVLVKLWRDKKLYEYGLKNASIIAVQGVKQQELLRKNYNLNSYPVNMVVEIAGHDEVYSSTKDIDVLWVNNLRPFKRPELVIELAKRLPHCRFTMIGGPCSELDTYYKEVKAGASKVANMDFVGPVSYSDIGNYFNRARVFVNTSDSEGFPNSFLQAWVRGVPVVSFFDPDDIIVSNKLGYRALTLENMMTSIDHLLRNTDTRTSIGIKAKAFAINHYSPKHIATRYIELIHKKINDA